MRLTKRNAENFSQRRKAFMQQLKPREIYATKDGLREVQYITDITQGAVKVIKSICYERFRY